MKDRLTNLFRLLSLSYICIWALTFLEAIFLFSLFREDFYAGLQEDVLSRHTVLNTVTFIVGLGIIGFAGVVAFIFNKELKKNYVHGGGKLFWSILLLLFPVLCTGNIFGGNISIAFLDTPYENSFTGLSIVSLILFTLFPVFSFWGWAQISSPVEGKRNGIPELVGVKWSLLALMLVSILLSPLLMTLLNANSESSVMALDIVGGVTYGGSLCLFTYYVIKEFKRGHLKVSAPESCRYVELNEEAKVILAQTGKTYLYLWGAIFISVLFMFIFYAFQGIFTKILTYVTYAIGWVAVIYGIKTTLPLSSVLKRNFYKIFPYSIGVLALTSLLSLNSIFGANFWLGEHPNSIYELQSGFASTMRTLGIISLFIFTLFPILSYIGTYRLAGVIPELKRSRQGALILLISSIIFSPLLLTGLPSSGGKILIYLLALLSYGAGVYLFTKPWDLCSTIREDISVNKESNTETYEPDKIHTDVFARIKSLNIDFQNKYIISAILGLFALVVGFLVFSWFDTAETEIAEELENTRVDDTAEREAMLAFQEQQRQDSIAKVREQQILESFPNIKMLVDGDMDYFGVGLKKADELGKTFTRKGYERVNNNKYIYDPEGTHRTEIQIISEMIENWRYEEFPEEDNDPYILDTSLIFTFSNVEDAIKFENSYSRKLYQIERNDKVVIVHDAQGD